MGLRAPHAAHEEPRAQTSETFPESPLSDSSIAADTTTPASALERPDGGDLADGPDRQPVVFASEPTASARGVQKNHRESVRKVGISLLMPDHLPNALICGMRGVYPQEPEVATDE